MVSHPETGSDLPIGSDRDRGRDTSPLAMLKYNGMHVVILQKVYMAQKVYVHIGITFKMNNLHPVRKPT